MDRVNSIISAMINKFEGGFSNHPSDRGGPTNMGVTQKIYSEYLGKPATIDMVRSMPREHAMAIYRSRYWFGNNIDRLPEALQPVMFDMSVNMGPGTAVRLLQHALGDLGRPIIGDGIIGQITAGIAARAIADFGAKKVIDTLCDRRREYYQHIITSNPSQAAFKGGWYSRCESFRLPSGG